MEAAEAIIRDMATFKLDLHPPWLLGGYSGYALFYEMAARVGDAENLERAAFCLQMSIKALSMTRHRSIDLHGGLCGIAWVAAHLSRLHPELDVEDLCSVVDDELARELGRYPSPYPCGIREGLAGMGLYALERMPHPRGRELLAQTVVRLDETAERTPQGATWNLPKPFWPIYGQDATFPQGLYVLGLAHGIPGAIMLLGAAHASGVERERANALLESAFTWFTHQAKPEGHPQFAHYLDGTKRSDDERFSWCVGNPGTIAALWWGARLWGNLEWQRRTHEWAVHLAQEALHRDVVRNSSNLCCGSAGTAHIFLRLAMASDEPAFQEAAVHWIQKTLELRQPGQCVGGYCFEQLPDRPTATFQYGSAGIGLTLLAAATDIAPDWDPCLMLSIAPAATGT